MIFYVQTNDDISGKPEDIFELEMPIAAFAARIGDTILDKESLEGDFCADLMICGNETIRDYNSKYRDIDRETDVLSFPCLEFDTPGVFCIPKGMGSLYKDPDTGLISLGDIIISAPKAVDQAREYGHSLKRELGFLIAHSLLHLCGYDHMTPEDEAVMFKKQEDALNALAIIRD